MTNTDSVRIEVTCPRDVDWAPLLRAAARREDSTCLERMAAALRAAGWSCQPPVVCGG